ncbi:MAG: tryptophan synthase subunit alpha [Deltaproteobacteria bacterium]|nr:tryptophan synthase subunit alpha [Deltaproteobacteria bacterium]
MTRIAERFAALRAAREGGFAPFITAGDPDLETTSEMILALAENGADMIEIGIPFSDPSADGPTIQRASERALARGTTLRKVLPLVAKLRPQVKIPLLLMGYANPFYALGAEGCAAACADAGIDGILCPDLPPEEGADLYGAFAKHGVDAALLGSPTTTPARMRMLVHNTRGFLYYVSLTGVTAARSELASGIEQGVRAVHALSDVPVIVGFGISRPEHAAEVCRYADGVAVGSAIVALIERAGSKAAAVDAVAKFAREIKGALKPR